MKFTVQVVVEAKDRPEAIRLSTYVHRRLAGRPVSPTIKIEETLLHDGWPAGYDD